MFQIHSFSDGFLPYTLGTAIVGILYLVLIKFILPRLQQRATSAQ